MACGYALNAYFAVIGTALAQRIVKRIQRRLDLSIDLFSPAIDLPKHIARRVWQETCVRVDETELTVQDQHDAARP